MAQGDVYQLTTVGQLLGQAALNVFYYSQDNAVVTVGETIAHALATQWLDQFGDTFLNPQTGDYRLLDLEVINLFNDADAATLVVNETGRWAGGAASTNTDSTFQAVGYSEHVPARSTRSGAKRIGAVPDNISTDGVITDATYLAQCAEMSTFLASPVNNGTILPVATWFPCVVKRIPYTVNGKKRYRLPANTGEKVLQLITDVLFSTILTSQVSRKVGRGS